MEEHWLAKPEVEGSSPSVGTYECSFLETDYPLPGRLDMEATITNRIKPCNCGCKGTDPWHARRFTRVLKNVREIEPTEMLTTVSLETYTVVALAEAKLPWGVAQVGKVVWKGCNLGWRILRDN